MDTDDAYEVLQLTPPVSDDEVISAYRELTKKYHPDVSNGDTRKRWMRIHEAKKSLLEDNQRTTRTTAGTAGRTSDSTSTQNKSHHERSYTQNRRTRRQQTNTTHDDGTQHSSPTGNKQSSPSSNSDSKHWIVSRMRSAGSKIATTGLAALLFPGVVANSFIPWYLQIGSLIIILFIISGSAIPEIIFIVAMLFLTVGGIALLSLLALNFLVEGQFLGMLALVVLIGIFWVYYSLTTVE